MLIDAIKIPFWLLDKLVKGGKLNPSDVMTQSNLDDLLHIVRHILN